MVTLHKSSFHLSEGGEAGTPTTMLLLRRTTQGQLSKVQAPVPSNSSPYRDTQRQSDTSIGLFTAALFVSTKD